MTDPRWCDGWSVATVKAGAPFVSGADRPLTRGCQARRVATRPQAGGRVVARPGRAVV